VPRARLRTADGKAAEWESTALRAYQRRTLSADALIASTYLAGTNTRRVWQALAGLFSGTVGKDTMSRTWRKVKSDGDAWNARSLADEAIVRLVLDRTWVRVRFYRKATAISLLVVLGVRADGQKVLLASKSMGGQSAEAWPQRARRSRSAWLRRPGFLIVDGAPGLDKAIAAVWELYGAEVSPDLISRVTDTVLEEVRESQSWPLDAVYRIVLFDAMRVKIRDEGLVKNKAVCGALAYNSDGETLRHIGLSIQDGREAKKDEIRLRLVSSALKITHDRIHTGDRTFCYRGA
jgi:transposase-like protein